MSVKKKNSVFRSIEKQLSPLVLHTGRRANAGELIRSSDPANSPIVFEVLPTRSTVPTRGSTFWR